MASFTGLKNLGDDLLDYMMRHIPYPDEELSSGFHDLGNVFPGIYEKGLRGFETSFPNVDVEALRAIRKAQGNPEAMIDIYRAVPKGVRDFNTGDWVSTSKAYAKGHGEYALNGDYDLIKTKARAADIAEPGDSIAEQGYWGMPIQGVLTRGLLGAIGAGAAGAALSPDKAEAKVSPHFLLPYIDAWNNGFKGKMYAGTFEPEIFELIQKMYPNAKNNVFATLHAGDSRVDKDGWSIERTGEFISDMLNSKKGDIVKNWLDETSKSTHAKNGVIIPYDYNPEFAPFYIDKDGDIILKTIFSPSEARMEKLGYGTDGGQTIISRSSNNLVHLSPDSSGLALEAGTQQRPIPVVASQPDMGNTLGDNPGYVKLLDKFKQNNKKEKSNSGLLALIGGTGAALTPTEAQDSEIPIRYIPGAEIAEQMARNAPITYTVDPWHSLSVGARAVTEGVLGAPSALVNQVISPFTDYRFGNPGEYVADWMGQAKPVTDGEKLAYGISKGMSEELPYLAGGYGLMKGGAGLARKAGEFLADSPKVTLSLGGLAGLLGAMAQDE